MTTDTLKYQAEIDKIITDKFNKYGASKGYIKLLDKIIRKSKKTVLKYVSEKEYEQYISYITAKLYDVYDVKYTPPGK